MKLPYDSNYQPPFPAIQVSLINQEDGLHLDNRHAYLDTGADATMVPLQHLRRIQVMALHDVGIRSHWGEWRSAQLFMVDIAIDSLRLPGVLVVGDEIGDEVILGRNVLNKLRLLFDGPANQTELLG